MSGWATYEARLQAHGTTKRESNRLREIRTLNKKLPDSLSYTTALLYPMEYGYNIEDDDMDAYAIRQNVAIINSDNLNEKTMISMPGEDIELGSLVEWMDQYWLVTERDANTTVYTKTKLLQCNHLLHWINPDDMQIMSQWCVIEDGTKYLTGELEDRNQYGFRTWKRVCKKTHRIAGKPLEPQQLQRNHEIWINANA